MSRHLRAAALVALACVAVPAAASDLRVQDPVPFSESAYIADNIKAECRMGSTLATSLGTHAKGAGTTVTFSSEPVDTAAAGRALKLEFVEAQSAGNAFTGHFKSATAVGLLFEDGKQIAKVTARRTSRGGAFAGFKGSCDVLDRTAEAIGRDIAQWLANPVDGAKLGDL